MVARNKLLNRPLPREQRLRGERRIRRDALAPTAAVAAAGVTVQAVAMVDLVAHAQVGGRAVRAAHVGTASVTYPGVRYALSG